MGIADRRGRWCAGGAVAASLVLLGGCGGSAAGPASHGGSGTAPATHHLRPRPQPPRRRARPRRSEALLERDLAALGYLPLRQSAAKGRLVWRYRDVPRQLRLLWHPARRPLMVRGAVMAFEAAQGLSVDGIAGRHVWAALDRARARHERAPRPYSYVLVSKHAPETLSLWRGGRIVYRVPANTGIPASPTPSGTWPIYLRYRSTTMKGHEPGGRRYVDRGVPWVSYFHGGDAVHGFQRASYGSRQSLGCVELPAPAARRVYRLTGYGTLVTVTRAG